MGQRANSMSAAESHSPLGSVPSNDVVADACRDLESDVHDAVRMSRICNAMIEAFLLKWLKEAKAKGGVSLPITSGELEDLVWASSEAMLKVGVVSDGFYAALAGRTN